MFPLLRRRVNVVFLVIAGALVLAFLIAVLAEVR